MTTPNLLLQTFTALNQAQYLTDLKVRVVDGKKVVVLCWYAKTPFFGRFVSYICYWIYDSRALQGALKEALNQHQQELSKAVIHHLLQNPTINSDQIYQSSIKLGNCYNRFTALTGQSQNEKRPTFSLMSPFLSASPLLQKLSVLYHRVHQIHQVTLLPSDNIPGDLRAQLLTMYQLSQQALQKLLCDFVESGSEAIDEDIAVVQIDTVYRRLQEIQQQLNLDPASDWIEFKQFLKNPEESLGEFNESPLDKARRMGKLAISLIDCKSVAQPFYSQLKEFVQEERRWFTASAKEYICTNSYEPGLQNLKSLYQKIDTIVSQTHRIGQLLQVAENIDAILFNLENICINPILRRAESHLRTFPENSEELFLITRLDRLIQTLNPSFQGPSKNTAQRVTQIAQAYLALQAAEQKAEMTIFELKTKIMNAKTTPLPYLERLKGAKRASEKIQSLQEKIAVFSPVAPRLMKYLQTVLKDWEKSLDFSLFPEEIQEEILSMRSYKKLEKIIKRYPQTAKKVEKILAQRAPQAVATMLQDLSKQVQAFMEQDMSMKKLVCEKLLQMEQEAKTQVPPQDLIQAVDYLKKLKEALILLSGLIAAPAFKHIALPCVTSYVTDETFPMKKKAIDRCGCEIHQALKTSLFLSRYYKMMRSHESKLSPQKRTVQETFDVVLELDPVKAVNLLLRMPRDNRRELKQFIMKIHKKTTSQGDRPFAKLPISSEKQQLLNLASRYFSDTPFAQLAEELDLPCFQGKSWREIDNTIFSQFHDFKKNLSESQIVQLRDAAAWIVQAPYFSQHDPLLVTHCTKVYALLAPPLLTLPRDLLSEIHQWVPGANRTPVSKGWNLCFDSINATKTVARFAELVNWVYGTLAKSSLKEDQTLKELRMIELTPLEKSLENKSDSEKFIQTQLEKVVRLLPAFPRIDLKKLDNTPFHTNYLLFGPQSPDPGEMCLVKKSFKESRIWNWYNTTKPHWVGPNSPRTVMKSSTRRRLQQIAEKNPEAVLDWIFNNPVEWKHIEISLLLKDLIKLSSQKHPTSNDPFALFPSSDQKDLFLLNVINLAVKKDLFSTLKNLLTKSILLHMVDAIHKRGIKEVALISVASSLNVNFAQLDLIDSASEVGAIIAQLIPQMQEIGGDTITSKIMSVQIRKALEKRNLTIDEQSLITVAMQISDGRMRDHTLKRLLAHDQVWSAIEWDELVLVFESIHDKAPMGLELFSFMMRKMHEMKNPYALLHYFVDENLRHAAETAINTNWKKPDTT